MKDELSKIVKGEILTSPEELHKYSTDTSLFRVMPDVVVCPKDTEDLKALVHFANDKNAAGERISLTARSAGTDMTGGPLNKGIVIVMIELKLFFDKSNMTNVHSINLTLPSP